MLFDRFFGMYSYIHGVLNYRFALYDKYVISKDDKNWQMLIMGYNLYLFHEMDFVETIALIGLLYSDRPSQPCVSNVISWI